MSGIPLQPRGNPRFIPGIDKSYLANIKVDE
jgi:hypothetical protein